MSTEGGAAEVGDVLAMIHSTQTDIWQQLPATLVTDNGLAGAGDGHVGDSPSLKGKSVGNDDSRGRPHRGRQGSHLVGCGVAGQAESRSIGDGNRGYPELQAAAFDIEPGTSKPALAARLLPACRQHFPFNVPTELLNHVCQASILTRQYKYVPFGIGVDWLGSCCHCSYGRYVPLPSVP